MSPTVRWVTETRALSAEIERIGRGPISLDSEADSFHHYREKVCLLQLSFAGVDLLIDPLAGLDLGALGPVLADRGIRKILHGADYDVRLLRRDFGFEVRGLFDTMVAARLSGERAFGLAALLEKYVGVKLDKRFQRADWSARPLSLEMQEYAVLDTRHLETLARELEAALERLGRAEWAQEEFQRLEAVRFNEESRASPPHLRIKGAQRLAPRGLAALCELANLREETARVRDVPPFRVMRDEVLLDLAKTLPRSEADVAKTAGLPRSWSHRGPLHRLLDAVERALALPEAELPQPVDSRERPRDPALEQRLRKLARERDRLAESLDLEPAVLASRQVLEQVLAAVERGQSLAEAPGLRRWQAQVLTPLAAGDASVDRPRAYHE